MQKFIVVVLLVALCSCGMREDELKQQNIRRDMLSRAWDACLNSGGVPIANSWLGAPMMERCARPPEEKGE